MNTDKTPITHAIRELKEKGITFTLLPYKYEEKGGTEVASRELGVDEYMVIKTLVMEDDQGKPFIILMHGNKSVSTKNMARILGVKMVKPCEPETAHRHTGYIVGGISPFGTRRPIPVYIEASVLDLPNIYINAGKKGLLAEISPGDLRRILDPTPVKVAI
jgi:Cys-tRNA(Pro) deacylase